ncbi:hypothetical protein [Vibrio genomosp. F10]|uniref:hypothetical protein n=1 Tax=Vibrio genomosp. F10 TaxID=723171 RepID=UPI00084C0F85|nr:hypothetical protein [Vibrio genomosp. F10]OEF06358.1 hypothetical protein A1QK_08215 [Vibrio genomosp. F10 str. 9ZD137]
MDENENKRTLKVSVSALFFVNLKCFIVKGTCRFKFRLQKKKEERRKKKEEAEIELASRNNKVKKTASRGGCYKIKPDAISLVVAV